MGNEQGISLLGFDEGFEGLHLEWRRTIQPPLFGKKSANVYYHVQNLAIFQLYDLFWAQLLGIDGLEQVFRSAKRRRPGFEDYYPRVMRRRNVKLRSRTVIRHECHVAIFRDTTYMRVVMGPFQSALGFSICSLLHASTRMAGSFTYTP